MTAAAPRPKQRDDLTHVEIDGEAVVYDETSGELHHLNPSATLILGLCDGSLTIEEMVFAVSEATGVPADALLPQVSAVIERFAGAGLLEPIG